MAQTVIGLFDNASEAQQAVQKLIGQGFSRENIDVSNSGSGASGASSYSHDEHKEEGGIGHFFKSLFSDDDDDDSDKYVTVAKRSGSIVTVHAQSAVEAEEAADILDDCGAVNVDERAAEYGYTGKGSTSGMSGTSGLSGTSGISGTSGMSGTSDMSGTSGIGMSGTSATSDMAGTTGISDLSGTTGLSGRSDTSDLATSGETKKIPIIEENMEVGKREVLKGGTRLRSRIIERPVEESVRLREENVRVERTPVNRAATSADLANFEGTEIEMTEKAEVPVVSKEARVVEEVSLGKDVQERTETISDTVRKTEIDVEDLGKTDITRNSDGL